MMVGEGEPPTLKDIEQKRKKNFIENSFLCSAETVLTAPQMLGSNKQRISPITKYIESALIV